MDCAGALSCCSTLFTVPRTDGSQAGNVGAFGCEIRGFESCHCRLTSTVGSRLLATSPFLKNGVNIYFNNKDNKRLAIKDVTNMNHIPVQLPPVPLPDDFLRS